MTNLYDLLRQVVTAGVDTPSELASDELEYAASAILAAIRHETRHVKDELDKAAATGTRLTLTADERLVLINALIARRQNATVFAREEHLDLSHVAAICDELLHRIGDQP